MYFCFGSYKRLLVPPSFHELIDIRTFLFIWLSPCNIIIPCTGAVESRPEITNANIASTDTLYVSWNTGSISGIVNIAIKVTTTSGTKHGVVVVDRSSTDIYFRYSSCLFDGDVTIIVEVFDNCQQTFSSEPYSISLITTDELPSPSTIAVTINNYTSSSTSRISTHQPSAVINTPSPTLTSTPSSDTPHRK